MLGAHDLPEPLGEACREIAGRTRLRPHERAEVARELVAHCRDALEGGREPSEITRSMGDRTTVARLIRRGMIRKRSALFRAWYYATRGAATGFAVLVLFYVGFAVRFHAGEPEIKVNYIARLNERPLAIPEDQRAWPIYKASYLAIKPEVDRLTEEVLEPRIESARVSDETLPHDHEQTGFDLSFIMPDHPDFSPVRGLLAEYAAELGHVREAAALPGLGFVYSTRHATDDHSTLEESLTLAPPAEDPADEQSVIGVLLPHLSPMRAHARWLALDASIALAEGDPERAEGDLHAVIGLARHSIDEPFLIGHLVGLAVRALAEQTTMRLLHADPEFFTGKQLARIAHALASVETKGEPMSLDTERFFMEDILQRSFTDDGKGGGRLTPAAQFVLGPDELGYTIDSVPQTAAGIVIGPAAGLLSADRRQLAERYHGHLDTFAALATLPSAEMVTRVAEAGERIEQNSLIESARYRLIDILMPSMSRALTVERTSDTRRAVALAVIAMHAHRLEHGSFPASLSELSPDLLPSVPADPFDHDRPIRYVLTSDGPLIYSLGADGDDDGGTPPVKNPRGARDLFDRYPEPDPEVSDGDWVLYPPQD